MRLADIEFSTHGSAVAARLTGEIDMSNAGAIGTSLSEATPNGALALVVDLSEVTYVDSAGIQLMYQLRENLRTRGQSLRLVIPASSPASDALRLAGVSRHIETIETLQDALAEFA